MPQVVIENPVLNSPYEEPSRHFYFDEDGITDKVLAFRRLSSYFIPIAKPNKKGKQLELDTEWTKDRIEENKFINDVRHIVNKWRLSNYDGDNYWSTGGGRGAISVCISARSRLRKQPSTWPRSLTARAAPGYCVI
jgi:hypothetical protein